MVKRNGAQFKPSAVREMTEPERAWVGALVEGEGHIDATYGRVIVGSTEIETLSTLLRFVGCGGIYLNQKAAKGAFWVWHVGSRASVHELLRQIAPWMTSKQELALEVAG